MGTYSAMSMAGLKVECRRFGFSTYGKKVELEKRLLEAYVKRTRDTLHKYPAATTRPLYPLKTVAELRTEARARKLGFSVTKDALVKSSETQIGKRLELTAPNILPIQKKLPTEIQEFHEAKREEHTELYYDRPEEHWKG